MLQTEWLCDTLLKCGLLVRLECGDEFRCLPSDFLSVLRRSVLWRDMLWQVYQLCSAGTASEWVHGIWAGVRRDWTKGTGTLKGYSPESDVTNPATRVRIAGQVMMQMARVTRSHFARLLYTTETGWLPTRTAERSCNWRELWHSTDSRVTCGLVTAWPLLLIVKLPTIPRNVFLDTVSAVTEHMKVFGL
jgi:hypothetical protein